MVVGETTPKGGFGSPFTWLGGGGDPLADAVKSCPGPPQYNFVPESRESFGKRLKDLYGPWPGNRAASPSPAPCPSPVSVGTSLGNQASSWPAPCPSPVSVGPWPLNQASSSSPAPCQSPVSLGMNESTGDLREVVAMLADKAVASQSLGSEVLTIDSEAVSVHSADASEDVLEGNATDGQDECPVIRDNIWGDDTVDTRNLIRQAAGGVDKQSMASTPGKAAMRISEGSPSKVSGQNWPAAIRSPKRSADHFDKENESPHVRQRFVGAAGPGMKLTPNKSPGVPPLPRGQQLQCAERTDMVPRQDLEDVAYERDFYFAKLRRIEALCDMYQEKPSLFASGGLRAPVVEALYCSEDPAEIPRYPVGC